LFGAFVFVFGAGEKYDSDSKRFDEEGSGCFGEIR
jgi:hypothetical protein